MASFEYKVLEIRVSRLIGPKVPADINVHVDKVAAEGWELDKCVPILAPWWLPFFGSATQSVLLFFRRERRG